MKVALLSRAVTVYSKKYHPIPGDGSVEITHISVYICPAKLHDRHVKSTLFAFGEVVRIIRPDAVAYEDVNI